MTVALTEPVRARLRKLKRYPAYRDSGLEWLGKIPLHWEVKRLRFSVRSCQNGIWGNEPDGLHDVPCVRAADFDRIALRAHMVGSPLRSIEKRVVQTRGLRAGDLLLEVSGGGENQPVGTVVLYDHDALAVCSNFVARMTVAVGFDPGYLTYLHAALYRARLTTRSIKQNTGLQNLDSESYLNEVVAFAPDGEQRAITAFLDRETAKIDALVAKKERLIELLQEKRTALITRAVTKGLDQSGPMKESGVAWLGQIPAHWDVRAWRYSCRVTEGQVAPDDDRYRDRIMIAPNHVEPGTGRILFTETADEQGAISGKYLVKPGDLIYSKIRPALNKACIATGDWLCSADMYPVAVKASDLHVRFLLYFVLSGPFVRLMVDESMRVAMPKVNRDKLASCPVPIPPLSEQLAITAWLDGETPKIDRLLVEVSVAVERLEEYRRALVSAAVTGRIDVRGERAA